MIFLLISRFGKFENYDVPIRFDIYTGFLEISSSVVMCFLMRNCLAIYVDDFFFVWEENLLSFIIH